LAVTWLAILLAGLLASLAVAPAADAEGGATSTIGPAGGVEVRLGAVVANNSGRGFDPRLVSLHKQFDSLFPYNSYELLKEERQRVAWGAKAAFDIPGGQWVIVTPREYKNSRIAMKVVVIEGSRPIVNTSLSLRDHATLLVGGPRQSNGVLILSIGADRLR
jgi:hypothetical protein